MTNPELFQRVGIPPPKGCLLFGPPGKYHRPSSHSSDRCLGTGKTLLARAVASQLDCNFLKVVSSAIVDKYIGESARMIREMFAYAKIINHVLFSWTKSMPLVRSCHTCLFPCFYPAFAQSRWKTILRRNIR